jgi:hypothetical protein
MEIWEQRNSKAGGRNMATGVRTTHILLNSSQEPTLAVLSYGKDADLQPETVHIDDLSASGDYSFKPSCVPSEPDKVFLTSSCAETKNRSVETKDLDINMPSRAFLQLGSFCALLKSCA